jgi:uncharacterized RDD family membrane protein YckC
MNSSTRSLLTYILLASCCLLVRGVPAHDVESSAPAKLAAVAASDHQDDVESTSTTDIAREEGDRNNVVAIGHDANLAQGERADAVVSVFGSATNAGDVDDALVSVLGDARATGPVGDATVAVLGNVYIDSKIGGDVVAVLGNVELGPKADIHGQVVIIGGLLTRDPGAVVHGGVQTVVGTDFGGLRWLRRWIERCLLYGRPLAFASGLGWAWGLALGCLALYAFIGLLFRDAVERCTQTFELNPGQSIIAALLSVLLTPVVFVLLCITVIGVLALPLLVIALLCACIFGKVVILASLGRRCTGTLAAGANARTAIAVLVGGVIALVLYTIPVVGFIVFELLSILGLGVVIYTLLLAGQAAKRARPTVSAATAEGPAAPPPELVAEDVVTGGGAPADEPASSGDRVSAKEAPGAGLVAAPRAGFWIRIAALAIDTILIGVVLERLHHPVNLELIALAAYGAVMWKLKSSTIGGIICGLKVVRLDGREMDWATAIVRALSCFLSLVVAGLGFFWIAVDREKQSWHDKIAGTVVIRATKSPSLV